MGHPDKGLIEVASHCPGKYDTTHEKYKDNIMRNSSSAVTQELNAKGRYVCVCVFSCSGIEFERYIVYTYLYMCMCNYIYLLLFTGTFEDKQTVAECNANKQDSMATAGSSSNTETSKEKRIRKVNWSPEETKFLVEQYKKNIRYLKGDFPLPGCTSREKIYAWERIATSLHKAFPAANRSVKECQKRWQTVQAQTRARLARYKKAVNGTGKNVAEFRVSGHFVLYLLVRH